MTTSTSLLWGVLIVYGVVVYLMTPRRVTPAQFYRGGSAAGAEPGLVLLVSSAAVTWIFAKSIANAASLSSAFGVFGGIGYSLYYISFFTAAVAIYFIRTRGGHGSLAEFLTSKYGSLCAKLFLIAIAVRLLNEVWSNTKVTSLYFGPEGSEGYWTAAVVVTAFTLYYSVRGGLRSSMLTDGAQMVIAAVLLVIILAALTPGLAQSGLPRVDAASQMAGLTFCGLALVQTLSYPFHDPVLTDRAFIIEPRRMVKGMILAGVISGVFILLFSIVGLYARSFGIEGNPSVAVPAAFGLPMLLVFNAIMLASAGSTLDSTFSSSAKLAARDWPSNKAEPTKMEVRYGMWVMAAIALLGNLPLLSIYMGDKVGPAIISATTISGTMVMGLAPIFLLSFIKRAGAVSFHLAFWPGLLLGVLVVIEGSTGIRIFPSWIDIGSGKYADDLGVNVFGLGVCVLGYIVGIFFGKR
ncbi:MAG: Na+/proline symporter [Thermodesulfobacteriota bacterium]